MFDLSSQALKQPQQWTLCWQGKMNVVHPHVYKMNPTLPSMFVLVSLLVSHVYMGLNQTLHCMFSVSAHSVGVQYRLSILVTIQLINSSPV